MDAGAILSIVLVIVVFVVVGYVVVRIIWAFVRRHWNRIMRDVKLDTDSVREIQQSELKAYKEEAMKEAVRRGKERAIRDYKS